MKREISILFVAVLMLSIFVPMASMTMATTVSSETPYTATNINTQLSNLNKLADETTQNAFKNVLTKFEEARRVSLSLPPNEKVIGILSDYLKTGEIPKQVRVYPGFNGEPASVGVIIVTDSSASLAEISRFATIKSTYPLGFANVIIAAVSSQTALMHLASLSNVVEIMGDVELEYPKTPEFAYDLGSQIGLTQFNATYIQGAWNASQEFNVNGSGVKIAVIDTGVDFGNPEVRQARDADGYPLSINLDGFGIGMATLEVNKSDIVNNTLPVANKTVYYFTPLGYYAYTFDYNLTISSAQYAASKSGLFRVGVFFYFDASLGSYIVPFLMIDTTTAKVYDTVYFDLSSFYYEALNNSGDPLGINNITYYDHSFADEAPHVWGDPVGNSEVIARDFDGDGIPDISMGALAWGLDNLRSTGLGLIPGIGAVDNVTPTKLLGVNDSWPLVVLQWARDHNHGTNVAGTAAGMGKYNWYVPGLENNVSKVPGMAPGASVIAANAWYFGELMSAWFWAAGLEYNAKTNWYDYNASRHADICTNSWGISSFLVNNLAHGFSLEDILADLLSLPGYFNESYPGMVFTIATGNGGFGYGTATRPAGSSLAISVGAVTLWYYWNYSRGMRLPQGTNQMIPWSDRGPTVTGEVKPDVVAIGAYAADSNSPNYPGTFAIWDGYYGFLGRGNMTTDLFGGTSQATPMVAGAAAVVIEALKKNGISYTPALVKAILMGTADDLGYDPFVQGAGRINVLKAVQLVFGMNNKDKTGVTDSIMAYTVDTWNNIFKIKNSTYFADGHALVNNTDVLSGSLYGGILQPGESTTATVSVLTYMSGATVTVTPMHLELTDEIEFYYYSRFGEDTYFNITKLLEDRGLNTNDLWQADLLQAYVAIDGYDFAMKGMNPPYVYLVDWHDENGDGIYNHTEEMHRINADFRYGPVFLVTAGHVANAFTGTPTLVVRNPLYAAQGVSYAFKVILRLYKRAAWGDLTVTAGATGNKFGLNEFNYTVTIQAPNDALPGAYEGVLKISVSNGSTSAEYYMPVSYAVAQKLDTAGKLYTFSSANLTQKVPYTLYQTYGAVDWSWRWESGDFRFYPLLVEDNNSKGLVVDVSWAGEYSQVDVIVVYNSSKIVVTSPIKYIAGGIFDFSTTTGDTEQVLFVPSQGPGLYTVVIHQTESDGMTLPEEITLKAVYLTEDPLKINWQTTVPSSVFDQGVVSGWMNGTVDVSSQAHGLIKLNGMTVIMSQVKSYTGELSKSLQQIKAPWGEVRPGTIKSIYLPAGAYISATLDWKYADDVDLIIVQPNGKLIPNWADSATLNHPEHIEFTAPMAGDYLFIILLYSGDYAVYTLDVAISLYSLHTTANNFTINTADSVGTQHNVQFKIIYDTNAVVPTYSTLLQVDNTNGTSIAPDKTTIGVSGNEAIYAVMQPASLTYFYNFTYENGTEIQSGTLDWDSPITINATALGEGYYKLYMNTTDVFGANASWSGYIVIDAAAPDLSISGISDGSVLTGEVNIGVTVIETNLGHAGLATNDGKVTLTIDDHDYATIDPNSTYKLDTTKITSAYGDGLHTFVFSITDDAGKTTTLSFEVRVDNNPPTIQITTPTDGSGIKGRATISWTYNEPNVKSIMLYVDTTEFNATGRLGYSVDTTQFADGPHTIKVVIEDLAGHTAQDNISVIIDNTAPSIKITSPANGSTVQFGVTISWNLNESHVKQLLLTIDNNVTIDITGNTSYTWDSGSVEDGYHTIKLTVIDIAGSTDTDQVVVNVMTHTYTIYMSIGGVVAVVVIVAALYFFKFKKTSV